MSDKPAPILGEYRGVSKGASLEDVSSSEVPEGIMWELRRINAEDETTAFTSLRLGITRGTTFIPLAEQIAPLAATLYGQGDPYYLAPGERMTARFTGTTTADKLVLRFNGLSREP